MATYQTPYPYNQMQPPKPPKPSPGPLAVASLVLGIISDSLLVITCCMFPWISIISSIVGLVLGIMGNRQNKTGTSLAGIITCAVGLALSAVVIVAIIIMVVTGSTTYTLFDNYYYT